MFNRFVVSVVLLFLVTNHAMGQVVRFRLEATDSSGAPIDSVTVGEEFLLKTYSQHVGGYAGAPEDGGVFAGYLDIHYEESLATVSGDIEHAPLMSNGKNGDLSPGFMDNIGGFAASENPFELPIAPGAGEEWLFSVPMQATGAGELSFIGSESLEYPIYDVLVYGLNVPVEARDIDFGAADIRIDFGSLSLNVQPVPEPNAVGLLLIGTTSTVFLRRRRSGR